VGLQYRYQHRLCYLSQQPYLPLIQQLITKRAIRRGMGLVERVRHGCWATRRARLRACQGVASMGLVDSRVLRTGLQCNWVAVKEGGGGRALLVCFLL